MLFAVPKNLGLNFQACSEGYFLSERPYSVGHIMAICDDLQCCKSSEVGGPKKVKNMITYYLNGPLASV